MTEKTTTEVVGASDDTTHNNKDQRPRFEQTPSMREREDKQLATELTADVQNAPDKNKSTEERAQAAARAGKDFADMVSHAITDAENGFAEAKKEAAPYTTTEKLFLTIGIGAAVYMAYRVWEKNKK